MKQQIQAEIEKWKNEADVQAKNAADGFQYQSKAAALEASLKKLQQENAVLNEKLSVATNDHLNAIASSAESTHLQSQVADLKLKSGMLESDLVTLRQNFLLLEEKYNRLQKEKNQIEEQMVFKSVIWLSSSDALNRTFSLNALSSSAFARNESFLICMSSFSWFFTRLRSDSTSL